MYSSEVYFITLELGVYSTTTLLNKKLISFKYFNNLTIFIEIIKIRYKQQIKNNTIMNFLKNNYKIVIGFIIGISISDHI